MSDPFPVFNADGSMMGNLTSDQGQTPAPSFWLPGSTITSAPNNPGITYPTATNDNSGSSTAYSNSKFNGWANYFTGQITGLPSGNATGPGGTNPGATGSPSSTALLNAVPEFFNRSLVFILGAIFIAAGLYLFGKDALKK